MKLNSIITVIDECIKASEACIKLIDATFSESSVSKTEKLKITDQKALVLKSDLELIEDKILQRHNVGKDEFNAAFNYYAFGTFRDKEVVAKSNILRKLIGKHLITKSQILPIIRAISRAQIESVDDVAEQLFEITRSNRKVPIQQVIQSLLSTVADEYILETTGLGGMEQFMLFAQSKMAGDPSFSAELQQSLEEAQNEVQSTLMQNAKFNEAIMMAGGGSGMGMGM